MANRYANLIGSNKIKDEYSKINTGFDAVQTDIDSISADLSAHKADAIAHLSQAEHNKLSSIEEGAQVNQNAFAKVNGVEADDPSDELIIEGGTGIAVTQNPLEKKVTITATGEAIPGPHGSAHLEFGADPIPYATPTEGGLMAAQDKKNLDDLVTAKTTRLNAKKPLLMMTYDFSGRVVHPDVQKVYVNFGRNGEEEPATYFGYTYWMVATPYPGTNDNYENPSLWVSNDGINWVVPFGYTNPIVAPLDPAGTVVPFVDTVTAGPFNSDPDWIIDPWDSRGVYIKMIYRQGNTITGENKIMYTESEDGGKTWSVPVECYNDTVHHNLSPAIVQLGPNDFVMYYVETLIEDPSVLYVRKRTSTDMITWSDPIEVNIPPLPENRRPWHLDAIKTKDGGIEILLNAKKATSDDPDSLFILSSTDGTNFVIENDGNPIVTPSGNGWDDKWIYRGTFVKRSDGFYQIWYSACDKNNNFRIGYIEGDFKNGFNTNKGGGNGLVAWQRMYFKAGHYHEGFANTIYCADGMDLNILGEINTISGRRRIMLWDEVFTRSDVNVLGGGYDTGHLVLGSYHIWVDSAGRLRIKNGVPTSDTDGIVVGTQT